MFPLRQRKSRFNLHLSGYGKCWLGALLLGWSSLANALQSLDLSVGRITVDDWVVENLTLSLASLDQASTQWVVQSASLKLPPPWHHLSAFNISCNAFQWRDHYLRCRQGRGRIDSDRLKSPTFDFSLHVENRQATLSLDNLRLFGGRLDLAVRERNGEWRITGSGRNIDLAELQALARAGPLQNVSGAADLTFDLQGRQDQLLALAVEALLRQTSLQAGSKIAGEKVTLATTLQLTRRQREWRWHNALSFREGALYVEPVFLEAPAPQAISFESEGIWREQGDQIDVRSAALRHPGGGSLQATAVLNLNDGDLFRTARFNARIPELSTAAPIYLAPFLEAGPFAGLELSGRMNIELSVERNAVEELLLEFSDLGIDDPEQRLRAVDAEGRINWGPVRAGMSSLSWRRLQVKAIPVGAGQIEFMTQAKQFRLQQAAEIPLLGGRLHIDRFSYAADNEDADVHFSGSLHALSLERLSQALNWTPLSGEISGRIPSVSYRNKKLELDGQLTMQVFGGEVVIKKLASSGLFSDFAQFYADIDFDNLDLNAITRKFQFGSIEGRLSGFAHDLYLENWRPVSFYAWLGTPEDDDSRHRISQKAVENIASIGGGGAADAISRSFMRFFDNFGYDKLGFGCYLNNGVCQMMGVEAAENGYYLVKGGGLPRIDVIGYNPRLDWNVLLQRLRRITETDEAVVE